MAAPGPVVPSTWYGMVASSSLGPPAAGSSLINTLWSAWTTWPEPLGAWATKVMFECWSASNPKKRNVNEQPTCGSLSIPEPGGYVSTFIVPLLPCGSPPGSAHAGPPTNKTTAMADAPSNDAWRPQREQSTVASLNQRCACAQTLPTLSSQETTVYEMTRSDYSRTITDRRRRSRWCSMARVA